jgi:hypothetical protein
MHVLLTLRCLFSALGILRNVWEVQKRNDIIATREQMDIMWHTVFKHLHKAWLENLVVISSCIVQ